MDGQRSLRWAITQANGNGEADLITFAWNDWVWAGDIIKINPNLGELPALTEGGTTIDADYPGNDSPFDITLDRGLLASGVGLRIESAHNTIQGLLITNFPNDGILITGAAATDNTVRQCKVWTNGYSGVSLTAGASDNVIGGNAAARNVISGNAQHGVYINGSACQRNQVAGNYIGTDATGTVDLGNGQAGVWILGGADRNVIGPGNVLSGNGWHGIRIDGAGTDGNTVSGNYIGTDAAGGTALGNDQYGVVIHAGAKGNVVGGLTEDERNVISGNALDGVGILDSGTEGNVVSANYIGTDRTGTAAVGNHGRGVHVVGAARNVIGGSAPGERNVISGNDLDGVGLFGSGALEIQVLSNYIGTDATGLGALGNGGNGLQIGEAAHHNLIGGNTANKRNVISGNGLSGVRITGDQTDSNLVGCNYIGIDRTGAVALPNAAQGVSVGNGAKANVIGGVRGERNVLSGNGGAGVSLENAGTENNRICGNYIGVRPNGRAALPNGGPGASLVDGAGRNQVNGNLLSGNQGPGIEVSGDNTDRNRFYSNRIGVASNGTALGNLASGLVIRDGDDNVVGGGPRIGNVIAYNAGDGVTLTGSVARNRISANATYANDDLGIDWQANGVTDPAPLKIDSITNNGDGTYTVTGTAPANSTVEVFLADGDPSGYGEGKEFLATTTADGSGKWSVVVGASPGDPITATVHRLSSQGNNTSEFCANVNVPSG